MKFEKGENHVQKKIGVWIDHRKAVIVSLRDEGEDIREILSNMEKHIRFSGGAQDSAEDQRDRRFTGHLDKYYDTIISSIHDAESIFILGPGEAKGEFEKRLKDKSFGAKIVGIEASDKISYHEIAVHVRNHFQHSIEELKKNKKT